MAKKKASWSAPVEPTRLKNIVVLRGTEEWKAWLDRLAEDVGAPLTVTIDQALREMAERRKLPKPPRRTP